MMFNARKLARLRAFCVADCYGSIAARREMV